MRRAVVDNSTLSAVLRLLGEIPVKNKYSIDGDILALEQLIEAILFYDQIYYINDYKEEFKLGRQNFFNTLRPITLSNASNINLLNLSKEKTADICLMVTSGKVSDDDFRPFFEQLRMNALFTWNMSSSVHYLVMGMLYGGNNSCSREEFSKLFQMIFSESYDAKNTEKSRKSGYRSIKPEQFVNSDGRNLGESLMGNDLSSQVEAFSASLSWLSFKTAYYNLFCLDTGTTPVLHPIRQSFQLSFLDKVMGVSSRDLSKITNYLGSSSRATISNIREIESSCEIIQRMPIFLAWMATQTKNPLDFINIAHDLSQSKPFVKIRERFFELESLSNELDFPQFLKEINKIKLGIKEEEDKILQSYCVKTRQGIPVTPIINFFTSLKGLPKIPNIGINIHLPDRIADVVDQAKKIIPVSSHKMIFRNVVEDLVCIERLGDIHNVITSRVKKGVSDGYFSEWETQSKAIHLAQLNEMDDDGGLVRKM